MSNKPVIKSLTNDQVINDTIKTNTTNYQEYMCVFENACYEIPPEYFGPMYAMSTDFNYRKGQCENNTRDAGAEAGMYIRRSDWIDPTKQVVCGIFDLNGNRMMTPKGDKRQIPAMSMCDLYNKPRPDFKQDPTNPERLIVSKLINQEVINPVTDYDKLQVTDENKSDEVKENIMLFIVGFCVVLHLFYSLKFQVEKPYFIYDTTKRLFINRLLLSIIFIGILLYFVCPYGTCFQPKLYNQILKNPDSGTYKYLCENMQKFRGLRSNDIINICDNVLELYPNSMLMCNSMLNNVNSNRDIYNKIYSDYQGCSGCLIEGPCIIRSGNHNINYFWDEVNKSYIKYCTKCTDKSGNPIIFCSGNKCYPGKEGIFLDTCQSNKIIEHEVVPYQYYKDKIVMQCKHCKKFCETKA